MTSSSEAGGAGLEATPPTDNTYGFFRILVLSENVSRLEFVSSGLTECGYSVTTVTSCGSAIEMMGQPNAFHIVLMDDSLKVISLKRMFTMINIVSEHICIIIFTPDYMYRDAKLYIDQGALLVVPYDRIGSFYSILWQFILLKKKFNSELISVTEQRKKIRWDAYAKADFEYAVQFAGSDRSASFVAELMSVSGINTQAVASYMRRAGALGAGPSVVQPSSFFEQLAQAGAGPSVTDEGSRDQVLDTGDLMLSDLYFLPEFTQD